MADDREEAGPTALWEFIGLLPVIFIFTVFVGWLKGGLSFELAAMVILVLLSLQLLVREGVA